MLDRTVFIPPLNLTPKVDSKLPLGRIYSQKNDDQKSRNIVETLKQNQQFIREKSLYRYYISKNRSPESKEKAVGNPSGLQSSCKEGAWPKLARILSTNDIKSLQTEWQSSQKQADLNKERYFKRKNRMNRTQLCGTRPKPEQNTMDNEEEHSDQSLIDLLNDRDPPILKSASSLSFQDTAGKEAEMAQLRQQNQLISSQNSQLRQKLFEKEQKIEELTANVQMLQHENIGLQKQIEEIKNRISCNAVEEAQLLCQLQAKEKMIRQLQSGYKYMSIENTVLNHTKVQCSAQMGVISHLEKEKKMLEEKVRILYELSKKKRKTSQPPAKQYSEASLSFSMERDEKGEDENRLDDIPSGHSKSGKLRRNQCSERTFVNASHQ